jgi:predicted lysophospholipase L1 biosynthesis ABC-type transport system permease subunit
VELALQAYTGKYLHSTFKNGYIDGGRIQYVRLFSLIAIFILLIACINFMNLATARSGKRSKEVGIRKVVGAPRSTLVIQFIGEALVLTFIAFLIALAIAGLLLPAFNNITGKQMVIPVGKPFFWLGLFSLLVVTGIVAGSYPALFLSSLKPVKVLKGKLNFSAASVLLRKGLVVFQFSISIILIVGMIVIYRQVNYIQSKNIGYNRENLVYIPIEGELVKNYAVFKEEAGKLNSILGISKMRNSPTEITHHTNSIGWPGKAPDLNVSFADGVVGYDFVKTLKLQLKEGRDFSEAYGTDSASFILNENAANKIGYKNAVGQPISWGSHQGKVIGVLKDFHFSSLHQNYEPLILRLDENWSWGTILVRVKAGQTKDALAGLEALCKKLNPAFPFSDQFSDEEYARLYHSEGIVSRLAFYFSFLAIFISCLGLFGLAAFTAEQRTKEIGVRKVLGASVTAILSMLSTNFLRPIIIAMLVAFPLSWYAANNWLNDFAFKQEISWWILPLAGILTIAISLITVGFISVKSAMANPVKSLRSE